MGRCGTVNLGVSELGQSLDVVSRFVLVQSHVHDSGLSGVKQRAEEVLGFVCRARAAVFKVLRRRWVVCVLVW